MTYANARINVTTYQQHTHAFAYFAAQLRILTHYNVLSAALHS